jgi:myo-inositol-1(or 4)-monophosphatase
MSDFRPYLDIALQAAKIGGECLRHHWGRFAYVKEKTFPGDLVTEADHASEKAIIDFLKQQVPSHVILSEEAGLSEKREKDFLWVIDPLDGTTNYTHQHPMVAVSIGLLYRHEPIVGVIFNPIHNELYEACTGFGARLNKEPIQVSKVASFQKSLLATGFAYDRQNTKDNNYAEFVHFTQVSQGVRREGSAALDLAYLATGRFDGYWERGVKPWDMAAGVVIVREAGGKVTAYDGGPLDMNSGRILASNGVMHEMLIAELEKVKKDKDN